MPFVSYTIYPSVSLKRKDPKSASKEFVDTIKTVASLHPQAKIVVSKVAAIKDKVLRSKRDVFNAITFSELIDEPNVVFISHYNIRPAYSPAFGVRITLLTCFSSFPAKGPISHAFSPSKTKKKIVRIFARNLVG